MASPKAEGRVSRGDRPSDMSHAAAKLGVGHRPRSPTKQPSAVQSRLRSNLVGHHLPTRHINMQGCEI